MRAQLPSMVNAPIQFGCCAYTTVRNNDWPAWPQGPAALAVPLRYRRASRSSTRRLPMNCFQRGKQSCASNTTSPSGYLDSSATCSKGRSGWSLQRADVISEIDQIIAKLPPAQRKMVLARAGRELMIAEERRRLSK